LPPIKKEGQPTLF